MNLIYFEDYLGCTWLILEKLIPMLIAKRSQKRSRFLRSRSLVSRSPIATRSFQQVTIADRDPIAKKWSAIAIGDLLIGDRSCFGLVYHIQTSKVFMVKSSLYSSSSKDQMSIAIRWRPRHFPPKIPNKTKNKLFFKANGSVFINVCEDLSIKCFK